MQKFEKGEIKELKNATFKLVYMIGNIQILRNKLQRKLKTKMDLSILIIGLQRVHNSKQQYCQMTLL